MLELKPLPEGLKYAYLGDQQASPGLISSQFTSDQEGKILIVKKGIKLSFFRL